ncbi:MAG TPA: exodeoxyribonuclease III [Polyangiaceae bacterium]
MPLRVATWNVNGIRARHSELVAWASARELDVICLQELKASPEQVPEALTTLPRYWSFWHGRTGGYSGVSLHLRRETFADRVSFTHPAFDAEARIVQACVGNVVFVSVYVPNGGKDYPAKLRFLEAMQAYVQSVHDSGKQLVLCGDMNVARGDQDVHPSQRKPNAIGQRPDERALFEGVIASGLVDVGRALHPDSGELFTWWPFWQGARLRNVGWRLDYVLASSELASSAASARIEKEIGTSDHAPFVVEFDRA